jgi:hypothetical protein
MSDPSPAAPAPAPVEEAVPAAPHPYRLYVSGLPQRVTESDLGSRFLSYGRVSDVHIARGDAILALQKGDEGPSATLHLSFCRCSRFHAIHSHSCFFYSIDSVHF